MNLLHELHDKTLARIELDWGNGTMCVSFLNDYTHEVTRILCEGLTSLSYDRKHPWGKSVCVNKVDIDQRAEDATLTIEMQSGDLIVGNGASFLVSK
jgi:hypothetical protein